MSQDGFTHMAADCISLNQSVPQRCPRGHEWEQGWCETGWIHLGKGMFCLRCIEEKLRELGIGEKEE